MARGRKPKVVLKLVGLDELENTIKQLGDLPRKVVNRGAKAGAKIGLDRMKRETHFDNPTGTLKKGLTLKKEKHKKKGKAAYQVTYKPSFTKLFKEPEVIQKGLYGSKWHDYYYPASVEFGRLGKHGKSRPIRFMTKSADKNSEDIKQEMLNVLDKEIKKL